MALAVLGIMPEQFFDLDPAEFYYALQMKQELRKQDWHMLRLHGMVVANTSGNLKELIEDPKKLFLLPGETIKESVDEMKTKVLGLAMALGAETGNRHPDDPPTHLAKQKK